MDLAKLHAVLQACISQDPFQRKLAEDSLTQVEPQLLSTDSVATQRAILVT